MTYLKIIFKTPFGLLCVVTKYHHILKVIMFCHLALFWENHSSFLCLSLFTHEMETITMILQGY